MKSINLSEKREPLLADYCQFLLAGWQNCTQTYFADHTEKWSHDQLNRLLNSDRIPARELWRSVRNDIDFDEDGYLLFDDTVLSKRYAKKIQTVRRQWSGSEKRVIQGIGLVTCVYVNPKTQQYWIIDYRIYDYDRDAKTKLQHLQEMLRNAYFVKCLPFRTVLIDAWYASMPVMKAIQAISKIYYAPLKRNRLVNDSEGVGAHKRVETLTWTEAELRHGKLVHIKKFPKDHLVKLFRIASASGRTEYIATNDLSQSDATATKQQCQVRWKIEQLHRELKQTTGIDKCQSRQHRGQRNHIACCLWVWVSLTRAARATGQTIYRLKESLFDDYIRREIEKPSIIINFA
jgi:hypothetical protein